jgi:hypothetical protein
MAVNGTQWQKNQKSPSSPNGHLATPGGARDAPARRSARDCGPSAESQLTTDN